MDPTLRPVLAQKSLRWIFFGGKGGVGKTTTSSSFSVALAKSRPLESFLLISTDPAHNISDAFDQQFVRDPLPVNGVPNLSAVEISPADEVRRILAETEVQGDAAAMPLGSVISSLGNFFKRGGDNPGLDEVVFFAKIIQLVDANSYSAVIFDTAPTGHTLRFLGLPETAKSLLTTILGLKDSMGGMLQMAMGAVGPMLGMGGDQMNPGAILESLDKLKPMLESVEKLSSQFRNPELCTFVCVCIPEFLSLYETERLIQRLAELDMDVRAVVVNMVIDADESSPCDMCRARSAMQRDYIAQIRSLYEDFHIVVTPLLCGEVRGLQSLQNFGDMLLTKRVFCWDH